MEGDARVLECPCAGRGPLEGGRSRPVPSPAMKVVFDSHILIAALLFPGGRAEAAVANILDGVDDLLISRPIIQEVLSVLATKFSRDKEEFSRAAVVLAGRGAIVTGDKTMLAVGEYEGIRLITLADYLGKPRGGKKRRP